MHVAPSSNEDPLMDFSVAYYEDVPDAGGNDADREDDGWGVVTRHQQMPECVRHFSLLPSLKNSNHLVDCFLNWPFQT